MHDIGFTLAIMAGSISMICLVGTFVAIAMGKVRV